MVTPVTHRFACALVPLLVTFACVRVEAGTDPEPLGYGPGAHATLSSGYDPDPVPRPAPTPWAPPRSELAFGFGTEEEPAGPPEPVPYNDDLVRVCQHLASIATAPEGGSFDQETCLARHRIERVFRSITHWKTLAACLEAAKTEPEIAACTSATPRTFGPIAEYPRESEVCMHIFAITIVEQLGAEPMLDDARLLEFESLLQECVDSLVIEERADRKPAQYVEMLECMERSRTTTAAEACE
jgi:hypothetical protein